MPRAPNAFGIQKTNLRIEIIREKFVDSVVKSLESDAQRTLYAEIDQKFELFLLTVLAVGFSETEIV